MSWGLREGREFTQIHRSRKQQSQHQHPRLPVLHLPSKAAQAIWGIFHSSPVPNVFSSCQVQPVGIGQLGQEEPPLANGKAGTIWCVRKICDSDLADKRTPIRSWWRPCCSILNIVSSFLRQGPTLCLLLPQPRPRVGRLCCLPSPTLSKHAAPTEFLQ